MAFSRFLGVLDTSSVRHIERFWRLLWVDQEVEVDRPVDKGIVLNIRNDAHGLDPDPEIQDPRCQIDIVPTETVQGQKTEREAEERGRGGWRFISHSCNVLMLLEQLMGSDLPQYLTTRTYEHFRYSRVLCIFCIWA